MKQTVQFLPGPSPDHLSFDFHGELEPFEAKALEPVGGKLKVDFGAIPLTVPLFKGPENKFCSENIQVVAEFAKGTRFSLSDAFGFRDFLAKDLRGVYVMCRRMAHLVEDTMVLTLPHAPFYGLSVNFDFRVDVPKEVTGFEAFSRSIIVRKY